jgi:hypothetical protein
MELDGNCLLRPSRYKKAVYRVQIQWFDMGNHPSEYFAEAGNRGRNVLHKWMDFLDEAAKGIDELNAW